jgi:hypothetical protein
VRRTGGQCAWSAWLLFLLPGFHAQGAPGPSALGKGTVTIFSIFKFVQASHKINSSAGTLASDDHNMIKKIIKVNLLPFYEFFS